MTLVITHSQVAGTGVDADAIVDGADWDANHVLTGVISPAQGGTGVVNNDSSTLTISGAFGITFTVTATTSLTLPTTGTLATLAGSEALTNKTYNGNTWTAGTGTLTLGAGKTATISNTLTFTGTDASSVEFGAGGTVLYNGGALGTPSSGTLTNCTGLPLSTGITGAGTGVLAALAVNVGSAGAFVTFNGALGTPSSGTLTNATGLPVSSGISGLAAGVAAFLATPSSANLRSALTDESGTGVAYFQSGALGTPSSGTLTSCTGLPISTGVSGLGTGIATALAVNTGSAGAPVLFNGALGTPTSGTLTNCTGLPVSTGISGLASNVATFLATPSSANLAAALTDETGSGAAVFATSPTLVTPALGTPASGTLTNCTGHTIANLADAAWSTYTPTVTSQTGTITTVTNNGSTYKQIGKTVIARISFTVVTNGTGATAINATLPVASATTNNTNTATAGSGANYTSGKILSVILTSSTNARIFNYDATYPVASGDTVAVSIVYEIP